MPLFGAPTEVELSVQPLKVTAGDEIMCRVDIGEVDSKAQGCRVELGYVNTYAQYTRDSDGDPSRTWSDCWVPALTCQLFAGPPTRGPQVVRFRVPEDAPPTLEDTVEWQVEAIIDRRRGIDACATAPLVVQAVPGVLADRTRTPVTSSIEIPMTIELSTRQLPPGSALTGTVTANPTVDWETRGLRVQLVRERHEQDGIVERDVGAVVSLTGECELRPGEPIRAPFQIALATDAGPCFEAKYNSQHWYLEAVVDLPMMPDEVTRVELLLT